MVLWIAVVVAAIALAALVNAQRERSAVITYPWEYGLFYEDGAFVRVLEPGRLRLWPKARRRVVHKIGRNTQIDLGPPIDALSADRFLFRISVTCLYTVVDPRAAFENAAIPRLRVAIAGVVTTWTAERALEAILGGREALVAAIVEHLKSAMPDVAVEAAQVTSIALPPEVRRLFTEVERAKLEAQASLERARGEQAALRALANAARLLKDNPDLMRLRTLQAVSPTGKGATLVLGQDALAPSLRSPQT